MIDYLKSVNKMLEDHDFTLCAYDDGRKIHATPNWCLDAAKKLIKPDTKLALEIGSYLGVSSIEIAELLPEDGRLMCVDLWQFRGANGYIPDIEQQFLSNVYTKGVGGKVFPLKMDFTKAAAYITDKFDLIYVDGAHDEASVYNDLVNYYPKLAEDGVICGDDWCLGPTDKYECDFNDKTVIEHPLELVEEDSRYSVRRAVKRFAKENHRKVLSVQNLFWLV